MEKRSNDLTTDEYNKVVYNIKDENGWFVSNSWSVANAQHEFFKDKLNHNTKLDVIELHSASNVKNTIQKAKDEGYPIQSGDLMSWRDKDKVSGANHSTVVYSMSDDDITYTGHTDDTRTGSLVRRIDDYNNKNK